MKKNVFTSEGKALVSKLRCDGDLRRRSETRARAA